MSNWDRRPRTGAQHSSYGKSTSYNQEDLYSRKVYNQNRSHSRSPSTQWSTDAANRYSKRNFADHYDRPMKEKRYSGDSRNKNHLGHHQSKSNSFDEKDKYYERQNDQSHERPSEKDIGNRLVLSKDRYFGRQNEPDRDGLSSSVSFRHHESLVDHNRPLDKDTGNRHVRSKDRYFERQSEPDRDGLSSSVYFRHHESLVDHDRPLVKDTGNRHVGSEDRYFEKKRQPDGDRLSSSVYFRHHESLVDHNRPLDKDIGSRHVQSEDRYLERQQQPYQGEPDRYGFSCDVESKYYESQIDLNRPSDKDIRHMGNNKDGYLERQQQHNRSQPEHSGLSRSVESKYYESQVDHNRPLDNDIGSRLECSEEKYLERHQKPYHCEPDHHGLSSSLELKYDERQIDHNRPSGGFVDRKPTQSLTELTKSSDRKGFVDSQYLQNKFECQVGIPIFRPQFGEKYYESQFNLNMSCFDSNLNYANNRFDELKDQIPQSKNYFDDAIRNQSETVLNLPPVTSVQVAPTNESFHNSNLLNVKKLFDGPFSTVSNEGINTFTRSHESQLIPTKNDLANIQPALLKSEPDDRLYYQSMSLGVEDHDRGSFSERNSRRFYESDHVDSNHRLGVVGDARNSKHDSFHSEDKKYFHESFDSYKSLSHFSNQQNYNQTYTQKKTCSRAAYLPQMSSSDDLSKVIMLFDHNAKNNFRRQPWEIVSNVLQKFYPNVNLSVKMEPSQSNNEGVAISYHCVMSNNGVKFAEGEGHNMSKARDQASLQLINKIAMTNYSIMERADYFSQGAMKNLKKEKEVPGVYRFVFKEEVKKVKTAFNLIESSLKRDKYTELIFGYGEKRYSVAFLQSLKSFANLKQFNHRLLDNKPVCLGISYPLSPEDILDNLLAGGLLHEKYELVLPQGLGNNLLKDVNGSDFFPPEDKKKFKLRLPQKKWMNPKVGQYLSEYKNSKIKNKIAQASRKQDGSAEELIKRLHPNNPCLKLRALRRLKRQKVPLSDNTFHEMKELKIRQKEFRGAKKYR